MPQPLMSWFEQPAGRTEVIAELKAPREMVEVIGDLIGSNPCCSCVDQCHAHDWYEYTDRKCPYARAKELLERVGAA